MDADLRRTVPAIGEVPNPASPEFDRVAAGAQFRDRIARYVHAPQHVTVEALRAVTLAEMPVAWVLGELRYWPLRLLGRLPQATPHEPFLQTLIANGTLVLHDAPTELVTGSAGQLHRIDQRPVHFASREAFDTFADPRFQKLFMSVRVSPTDDRQGCWLVLEHATRGLSPSSERAFARYWRVIRPAGAVVTGLLLSAVAKRAERGAASSGVHH